MRYRRCFMVQTEVSVVENLCMWLSCNIPFCLFFTQAQYIFIHDAILEVIECGETEVSARELKDKYRYVLVSIPCCAIKPYHVDTTQLLSWWHKFVSGCTAVCCQSCESSFNWTLCWSNETFLHSWALCSDVHYIWMNVFVFCFPIIMCLRRLVPISVFWNCY